MTLIFQNGVGFTNVTLDGSVESAPMGFESDPNYANTVFWFDAREGLVDNSPDTRSLTQEGGTFTAEYYDGQAGGYFYTPADTEFGFDGDFTVEIVSLFNSANGTNTLLSASSDRLVWYRGNAYFEISGANSYSTTLGLGTIDHYAMTRSGSTVRVFENGTQVHSFTMSGDIGTGSYAFGVALQLFQPNNYGDIRVYSARAIQNVALYTSNFTPPSGNYLGY